MRVTCVISWLSLFCVSKVVSQHSYDHVEEHFQRSLGLNYHRASPISVSVDDHFAKALGDKWLKLKASSSSCNSSSSSLSSSSPPSSPTYIHSPGYAQSPKTACKQTVSPTTPNLWSDKWRKEERCRYDRTDLCWKGMLCSSVRFLL